MSLQIHRQCCTSHKNGSGNQQRKPERKSACTALQNFRRSRGQEGNQPRCAAPVPTEGRVWSPQKNMHLKTGAKQHEDVRGSVSSCSLPLCGRYTQTFQHSWMTCLQIDSLSHWTLHDIVFHSTRFSAQRQLMPHLTRFSTRHNH